LPILLTSIGGTLAADLAVVSQRNRHFHPDHLTVAVGTTVRVMNDDQVTHHLYIDSPDMPFDSGEQSVGMTIDLHFDKAGRFLVRCAIHPTMRLDVDVK
jgi:cytochrome c peroxidase